MPNWCENTVTLEHDDPAMIRRAETAFADRRFLAEFVPLPTGEWDYDWCVNEWGTKWDVGSGDGINDVQENSIVLYFDSAWAPPTQAYTKLVEQGFRVYATYYEPGMCFAGIWDNGSDDYYEYGDMSAEEIAETLPEELEDTYGISEQVAEWEAEQEDEEDLDTDDTNLDVNGTGNKW